MKHVILFDHQQMKIERNIENIPKNVTTTIQNEIETAYKSRDWARPN